MNLVYEFIGRNAANTHLPMVVMGRSMGATEGAMNMHFSPKSGKPFPADLIVMMSFSSPETIELQVTNLLKQLAEGQIDSVVKSALDHAIGLTSTFQNNLRIVRPRDLTDLEIQTQDHGVFAQGLADEDGVIPGSAPGAIVEELRNYRDRYFPFAHVYDFEAPQLKYGDDWWKKYHIDPMSSEGTHFLLSSKVNTTDKNRGNIPMEVPEKDLPKLEDQQFEVYALTYAMLDYRIDQSPITTPAEREKLRKQRLLATGDDQSFAYLRWYLKTVVNPRQLETGQIPADKIQTLDQIVMNPAITPGRDSGMYGRILRVYQFALAEKARVLDLLSQR